MMRAATGAQRVADRDGTSVDVGLGQIRHHNEAQMRMIDR
jgi:hypothetical protein